MPEIDQPTIMSTVIPAGAGRVPGVAAGPGATELQAAEEAGEDPQVVDPSGEADDDLVLVRLAELVETDDVVHSVGPGSDVDCLDVLLREVDRAQIRVLTPRAQRVQADAGDVGLDNPEFVLVDLRR